MTVVDTLASQEEGEDIVASQEEKRSGKSENGPTNYVVAQGTCFMKHSEDPSSWKVVKVTRPVGMSLCTTGLEWRGPQGGLWAEIDVERSPDEFGWVLVKGPGFGITGPLLISTAEAATGFQMIRVRFTKEPFFSCMLPSSATVRHLVDVMCARTSLIPKEVILTKGLPKLAPNGSGLMLPPDYTDPKDVLFKNMTLQECDIKDCLNLIYIGIFEEDYKAN